MAGIIFSEGSNVANSIYGKSQEPIKMLLEKRAEAFEQKSVLKKFLPVSNLFLRMKKHPSVLAKLICNISI